MFLPPYRARHTRLLLGSSNDDSFEVVAKPLPGVISGFTCLFGGL